MRWRWRVQRDVGFFLQQASAAFFDQSVSVCVGLQRLRSDSYSALSLFVDSVKRYSVNLTTIFGQLPPGAALESGGP
jgi:hypothetical protein